MKHVWFVLLLPGCVLCADLGLQVGSVLHDARFGCDVRAIDYYAGQPGMVDVGIPSGEWKDLTFTLWVRLTSTNASDNLFFNLITTGMCYCPEPVRRSAPDLLTGACGYPVGTNLSSAASFDLVFSHEGGYCPSNVFDRGCYTVSGWASNAVTVILGGNEMTLGPGCFNRNAEPGPSDGVVVDGTGLCSVAVSRLHAHQVFSFIDGVRDDQSGLFTAGSVVTNELVFVSFRLSFLTESLYHRTDLWRVDFSNTVVQEFFEDLPDDPAVRAFSSQGFYRIGLSGMSPTQKNRFDVFDVRCYSRFLSDSELLRVYDNGLLEIGRRGIPRWRNGY